MNSVFSKDTKLIVTPGYAAQKAADIQAKSSWQLTFARLVRDPASVISAAVIVLIVLFAIGAPLIAQWTGPGPTAPAWSATTCRTGSSGSRRSPCGGKGGSRCGDRRR
mgnify:CR=1 FL=1